MLKFYTGGGKEKQKKNKFNINILYIEVQEVINYTDTSMITLTLLS